MTCKYCDKPEETTNGICFSSKCRRLFELDNFILELMFLLHKYNIPINEVQSIMNSRTGNKK